MIVADFHLTTPILRDALTAAPGTTLSVRRVYAADSDSIRVQFRAQSDDLDAFDAALADDPTVSNVTVQADADDRRYYRIHVSPEARELSTYPAWVSLDAVLLAATGREDGWELRMRFPDREALAAYREGCAGSDHEFSLHRLSSWDTVTDGQLGLTDPQRAILLRAIEMGYFDIPRSASLADVGESLGITGQAASERLRRALKAYLTNTLYPEHAVTGMDSPSVEQSAD